MERWVVKFGTGILTDARKRPDLGQMRQLVGQVAALRAAGKQVVLVSSGAVGAGMGVLGFERRPAELAELQACAAVGQSRLMGVYSDLFEEHGLSVAQVLLIHDDLRHHDRHLNARNTLMALLDRGVVPIINENDAVSVTELKFGDNDRLAALVACLLPADLMVILTTADGLVADFGKSTAKVMPEVTSINADIVRLAGGTTSVTAVGGMATKVDAARVAMSSGIPMVIASGLKSDTLARVSAGEEEGTLFVPAARRMRGRKRWIAFFHHPHGRLVVDDGAKKAIREKGKSLLPPGLRRCEGEFAAGDVVAVCDLEGMEFARGQVAFDAGEIREGQLKRVEIIHRDNLVVL